ncbi:nitroreductase/quinone reductase family protein [Streptomyces sp. ME19-01-6]|uniref:nitroreductase/quinone reductase family protein n=1 Tax=Streptomyces sp. ME19-01-6 TaxID=3028686 RepID=UPI0029A17B9D|nr:nitroreductase/quinone reductase family protein [Streptomyces sp. ME19-01-6]MDX3224151.1 nitroreductase/quinone reductase family protein [Streptomyces sp. ME19-01-6]
MDLNRHVIEEFRANNGKVGGRFEGARLILLTTVGVRTGKPHTTPAVYLRDGNRYLVFGPDGPKYPHWYHNLLADPHLTVELGTEEGAVKPFAARAVVLDGEERDRSWELRCSRDPAFRAYAERTERTTPVVALHLLDLGAHNPERNRMIGRQLVSHHNDLRAELHRIRAEIDRVLAGEEGKPAPESSKAGADGRSGTDLAGQLRRHCLTFCYALQTHHIREDGSFTAFGQQFPHLAPAITRLRQEHEVVERALEEFETLLTGELPGDPVGVAELRAELDRLVSGLEEHFAYEEQHLLPALEVSLPS